MPETYARHLRGPVCPQAYLDFLVLTEAEGAESNPDVRAAAGGSRTGMSTHHPLRGYPPAALPSKPLAVQHLTRVRQNYDTSQRLKTSGQALDWAVTILFYTAQHEVVPPLRGVVRVAVHVPDVRDIFLLQVGVHALADKACRTVTVHCRGGAVCATVKP